MKVVTSEHKVRLLKRNNCNAKRHDAIHVISLKQVTPSIILVNLAKIKATFARVTFVGVSRSSHQDILPKYKNKSLKYIWWIKKDFPRETKLELTTSTFWFNRSRTWQQFQKIKFTAAEKFPWDNRKNVKEDRHSTKEMFLQGLWEWLVSKEGAYEILHLQRTGQDSTGQRTKWHWCWL